MDPLSISCGILASIQAANTAFKIIGAVRNAPREVDDLKQELSELEEVVGGIADTLREARDDTSQRYGRVLQTPLEGVRKEIEHLNAWIQRRFKYDHVSPVERVVWAKERSYIRHFNERLNRRKLNVLLAVAAAGM